MSILRNSLITVIAVGLACSTALAAPKKKAAKAPKKESTEAAAPEAAQEEASKEEAPASPCNEAEMDAFAYEDCLAEHNIAKPGSPEAEKAAAKLKADAAKTEYNPFQRDAYLTSSFGENRGTRYHAGIDYSTQMEEGWPIFAPEDGKVTELRVSPYGYGKVMYFKGKSGKTWVFGHQSSFGILDEQITKKQYASKKNDVVVKPNASYKKGDTLTFSGSTGIGNPHLHLEVRLDDDRVISPCLLGATCTDTIAPQILDMALWQGNEFHTTSKESLEKGCAVFPVKNEFGLSMAVKVVDYSREPKDNPMSIRRIEVWRYDEKVYSRLYDTLSYKKMLNIRDELLWTDEADTAGDWHFIKAKIAPLSTYRIEVEDFAGHVTTRKFSIHPKCKNDKPIQQSKQTSPLYTFLSKPMLDLFRCASGYKFRAKDDKDSVIADDLCKVFSHEPTLLAKIAETYPNIKTIQYAASASATGNGKAVNEKISVFTFNKNQTSINWTTKLGAVGITQKISGIPMPNDSSVRVLAVGHVTTDSLDYFEFHPKGMQIRGNWNVCIDNPANNAPLYWLGETTRDWFIFSKQSGTQKRCASINELRDIASIPSNEAPTLGFPYWGSSYVEGISMPALRIPVMYRFAGIADGNAITIKVGKNWMPAEYDSEPREIVLTGEKIPEAGESITVELVDEAKNKASYTITVPEM